MTGGTQRGPEVTPDLRLRAERPRVTRLSRKVLIGLGGVSGLAIAAALIYALQTRRGDQSAKELYSTENRTGIPEEIAFKTKPEIALDELRWACEAGLPRGVVLLDAGYGNNSELRADITALGLTYAAGILSTTTVWAPGARPLPAKTWSGRGRRPKLMRRDDKHRPVSVKALALSLPKRAWRTIEWREGAAEPLRSRFARLRIRAAHRDYVNAGVKLHRLAGAKLHHGGVGGSWGGICGTDGGCARSRERSSPEAAQRRALGAGLDGESAHRAIIREPRCALVYGRERTTSRYGASVFRRLIG